MSVKVESEKGPGQVCVSRPYTRLGLGATAHRDKLTPLITRKGKIELKENEKPKVSTFSTEENFVPDITEKKHVLNLRDALWTEEWNGGEFKCMYVGL